MLQQKIGSIETSLWRNNPFISIVVPTYEAKGKGSAFMERCLESIRMQSYNNFEVVVPDHSIDTSIQELIGQYSSFPINHFFNDRERGNSSVNMNEGIKAAKGDVIKILHFDDMFTHSNALQLLADAFLDERVKWGAFGFNHLQNGQLVREMVPSFSLTMGCPSTSFFINHKEDPIYFDENLIIINDHDMHLRLREKYGEPKIISRVSVTIGVHEDQVYNRSSTPEKEFQEWKYFHQKQIQK